MSYGGSGGDDQSEDGELRHSPDKKDDVMDFSLSEEDADTADSLDIKPPQASSRIPGASRSKRRDRTRETTGGRSRHGRSERHPRDERAHAQRDKHYAAARNKYDREREHHFRERDFHRYSESVQQQYRDSRDAMRYVEKRRFEDKPRKPSGSQTLDDLRERLLDKRRVKEGSDVETEKTISSEERLEQEMRREKLLEAEREMARQKEQYKQERERRHQLRRERERLRMQHAAKRQRVSDEMGLVVTVSDESEDEDDEEQPDESAREEDDDSISEDDEDDEEEQDEEDEQEEEEREEEQETVDDETEADIKVADLPEQPEETEVPAVEAESPKPAQDERDSLPPYLPGVSGCRSVEEFQCLNRIEEGTYGVVYRARDKRTDEIVALKRLKMEKEKEGFPITSLREINTLLKGQHPNIVTVREIVVGSNMDKIFIVMDYVEHDLKSLMETMRHKQQAFVPAEVKCLLKQLLGAVAHLHDNWILHRDLKTSNLLLSHRGVLKVGDFGLAREYGSPLKAYTPVVVTLWYRAPELLLCCKEYSTPIDMWSVGCIFAELLLMNALFPGKSELDQLNRVFKELGTPNERVWTGYSELPAVKKIKFADYPPPATNHFARRFPLLTATGRDLLHQFLAYDPVRRVAADEALKHPYFSEPPLPVDPALFPTWPAKSELGHRRALAASPKPPSGGRDYKQLGNEDDDPLGFHMLEARRLAALGSGPGFSLKF